ncbi:hypothetical protein K491DRAFT_605644 [Lophiostoma macrostomum CBS 122681]|uniref:Tyrosine specific protein phosphatases domain-containing protein n=1 Tax=Lophiostoma macrostomum CBS 122681 TaxID=1314788 RepID=A0A6A6SYK7_9PLEO|nr:hypothetical protein K491DRAFT_605644 [Lophiostoma macrostomum CBS 122681]
MDDTYSPLKSVPNFRDVGVIINGKEETKRLKTGLLYRGARPDEATYLDRQRLVKEFKVRTIIDLRTKTEHIEQAQKREAKIKSSAAVPQSNDEIAEPLKIPSVSYHELNFNGSAFSRMLISQLSWMEFFRLAGLMLCGYRTHAIRILAPKMEAMGLAGLATQSLDVCTKEVKQFFDVLADKESWPVMVHCTQGKDRTGLTVLLVLLLAGVDVAAVEHDYLMSDAELAPEREQRVKEISAIGLSEDFARCAPELVHAVHEHLETKYGGVSKYLESVGVSRAMQETVTHIIVDQA